MPNIFYNLKPPSNVQRNFLRAWRKPAAGNTLGTGNNAASTKPTKPSLPLITRLKSGTEDTRNVWSISEEMSFLWTFTACLTVTAVDRKIEESFNIDLFRNQVSLIPSIRGRSSEALKHRVIFKFPETRPPQISEHFCHFLPPPLPSPPHTCRENSTRNKFNSPSSSFGVARARRELGYDESSGRAGAHKKSEIY